MEQNPNSQFRHMRKESQLKQGRMLLKQEML